MNGNSLTCWTPALSRYSTAQLICWHVISHADKRLAGTSAVQTFIYQFVLLSKTNKLTLKRFKQKYLLLSRFTLEVVQISPKVKELLKSVHICQSYRKNKSGTFFYGPRCIRLQLEPFSSKNNLSLAVRFQVQEIQTSNWCINTVLYYGKVAYRLLGPHISSLFHVTFNTATARYGRNWTSRLSGMNKWRETDRGCSFLHLLALW